MPDLQMTVASSESTWWVPASSSTVEDRDKAEGTIAFTALIAFTGVLLLNPQAWFPALKPLRIAFLSGGLAAASLVWDRWRDRKALGVSPEIVICFVLMAWAFMTLPLSFWPGGSVAKFTDVYIKSVIVFWLLANVITTERQLRVVTTVLMLCSVPVAWQALSNFVAGRFLPDTEKVARITGYGQGLSAHVNDLALLLNLLLPLTIARFLSAKRNFVRPLCIGVLAINVVAIIVTFSRAGFLGLATIIAVYFMRMVRRRGADRAWAFMIIFVAALALPLAPSNYFDRLATVKSVASDPTGSAQARWRDIVAAAQFVMGHPIIGAGLGMDVLALNQVRGVDWVKVHNVYLEYAVDLGLPGAVLFLWLFYGVFKAVNSSRKRLADLPEKRDLFLLVEALETSLIVFAICGLFYPIAYDFFFYYIGGLALGARAVTQHALSIAPVQT